MKKSIILTALMLSIGSVAYAADYSEQLSELKGLLKDCEEKNISAPYETVGVSTFEKFVDYLAEDEVHGVDESIMEYNRNAMQNIYTETKENLTSYLSGEKFPVFVPEYDMMNTSISGTGITDGQYNVFSTGYGHFDTVRKDTEKLHDFGMNNFQMQLGLYHVITLPDWSFETKGDAELYHDVADVGGNRALKVVFKNDYKDGNYFHISKEVEVSPSARYYYGVDLKGIGVASNALQISVAGNKNNITSVGSEWGTNSYTFVTGENQTKVRLDIYVYGKCTELYIDNVFLKKGTSGENLIGNGDFELLYSQSKIDSVKPYLERAEKANVAVSFLLQPMYFWRIPGCEDMYADTTGTSYNVNDERAKAKVEQYLRLVVPAIAEYDAVRDICITNEPSFDSRLFPDFYNTKFRDYLVEEYGSLSNINSKWGTSYRSIDEITMPSEASKTAIFYDWICFNEDVYADWHEWMAGIIREYTDKPLHSKMMTYFAPAEYDDRQHLIIGTDAEKFGAFLDYAGNDSYNITEWEPTMIVKMMWYDYLHSVVDKPIYNSEDHFITDGSASYTDAEKNNVRYNLWQGAIHGRSMSTMWVWERSYDKSSAFYGSILHRPDCVAEAGYTSLDMIRNSADITRLSGKKPEVALLYSKTSRIMNDDYMNILLNYYEALLYSGKRVGFVTETSLDRLSDYNCLVIPGVSHTTQETLDAVKAFKNNGGKVIYYGDCLKYDKYGKSLEMFQLWLLGATKFTDRWAHNVTPMFADYFKNDRIKLIDNATGAAPLEVEYIYDIKDGDVLINMVNHSFDNTANVSVYLDGKKLSGMKNVLTGEVMGENLELGSYTPLMLKSVADTNSPEKPQNLQYSDGKITWNGAEGITYYVYYADGFSDERLYIATKDTFINISESGKYRVMPVSADGVAGESAEINAEIYVEPTFDIEISNCEWSNNGINATVVARNISEKFEGVTIKLVADNGKNAVGHNFLIPPAGNSNLTVSFPGKITSVTAFAINPVNGNVIAEVTKTN